MPVHEKKLKRFNFSKMYPTLNFQFVLLFLLISLIPIIVVSELGYSRAQSFLSDAKYAELDTIADLKVERITAFDDNIKSAMLGAHDFFIVKKNFPIIHKYMDNTDHPEYLKAKNELDGQLLPYREVSNLIDFLLLDTEGKLVYSTGFAHPQSDLGKILPPMGHQAVLKGKEGFYRSNIFRSDFSESGFEIMITFPAHDFEENTVGVIAFGIDMGPVYDLIQNTTGLGETGETLIGQFRSGSEGHMGIDKDHIMFLNTLRHDPKAALVRHSIIGSSEAIPMQEAAQGNSGIGTSLDYRGEETLGSWRYIPSLDWGLVAKIDTSEAFAPILTLRKQALVTSGVAAILVLLIAIILVGNVTRRRKAEKKVLELNGILKLLNKILRHDILNDVTVVRSNIGMLPDEFGENEEIKNSLKALERSQSLITQMRELEQAVSSGEELKSLNINEVVSEVIKEFSNMKINVKGNGSVMADKAFSSVVSNLFRNTEMHGLTNKVDISIHQKDKFIEVRFADNGKGIPDDVKPQLFTEGGKFGETGHTGLGLYIIRKTIDRYGGKVWVEDNHPKGAVFVLQIPRAL